MKNGIVNRCSAPDTAGKGSLCTLRAIWQVHADGSYHVRRRSAGQQEIRILIRTIKGCGRFGLADQGSIEVAPDRIQLLDSSEIIEYRTVGDQWQFFWFEFDGVLPLPHGEGWHIPNRVWEIPFFRQLQTLCDSGDEYSARAASELFGGYLLNLKAEEKRWQKSDRRIVEVLEYISEHSPLTPPVKELAKRCSLCERRFRTLFFQETGKTPKQYCEMLRLQLAERLLTETDSAIKEISAALGYSSQFSFCAAFRNFCGVPPSEYRRTELYRPR